MTADGRLVGVTVHRGGAAIRSVTAIRLGPDGLGGIAEGLAAVRGGAVVSGVAHGPLDRQGRDDPAAAGIAGVHQVEQRCEQRAGLVDVGAPATSGTALDCPMRSSRSSRKSVTTGRSNSRRSPALNRCSSSWSRSITPSLAWARSCSRDTWETSCPIAARISSTAVSTGSLGFLSWTSATVYPPPRLKAA